METFLTLKGCRLTADGVEVAVMTMLTTSRETRETEFIAWVRLNVAV
jgi:prophage maintenance system killer protein